MNWSLFKDVLISTIFTFVILGITQWVVKININALNTFTALDSKISYTDFYFSKLYDNVKVDSSIVLINIAEANRLEIAEAIDQLNLLDAEVIGLDVSFIGAKDSIQDESFKTSVLKSNNIVFPHFDNQDFERFWGSNEKISMGSNEFIADENGIVKYVNLGQNESGFLFTQCMAEAMNKNPSKSGVREINFFGDYNNFVHLEMEDIYKDSASRYIKNKAILLGYSGTKWNDSSYNPDKFYTPFQFSTNRLELPNASGIVIHANVLHNLLNDSFIRKAHSVLGYIILFGLLLLANWFYIRNYKSLSVGFYLECRLFQVLLFAVVTYIIFLVFHLYRVKFEWADWMLVIVSSFDFTVVYAYTMYYLGNKFGIESYVHKKLSL